jgi:hypothetical protein
MNNATSIETEVKTPRTKEGFELQSCGRCGGCGKYSYCQMYGDKCFKCQGSGYVFTKRGRAASIFYGDLLKKPASEVQVGELVYCDSMFFKPCFSPVIEVKADELNPGMWTIISEKMISGHNPTDMVRVGRSAEFKADARKKAMEYQANLTKMGVPRK